MKRDTKARSWLLQRNTALCTLDALHLAIAVEANALFFTADISLAKAAEKLGISDLNISLV